MDRAEAVVLAGGRGTRLRSEVVDRPKPMAPIAGRPFLEILLASLARKGFRRVVISVGYMADVIMNHFGGSFAGMDLVYAVEDLPLGTGGAVRQSLARCTSSHAFVLNGDTFVDFEAAELEAAWERSRAPIIVAREVPDTSRFGTIEAEGGFVRAFREHGSGGPGLVNAGVYVFPPTMLDAYVLGKAFSLEADFLSKTAGQEPFGLFVTKGRFIDIGIPEEYSRAQTMLAGQ